MHFPTNRHDVLQSNYIGCYELPNKKALLSTGDVTHTRARGMSGSIFAQQPIFFCRQGPSSAELSCGFLHAHIQLPHQFVALAASRAPTAGQVARAKLCIPSCKKVARRVFLLRWCGPLLVSSVEEVERVRQCLPLLAVAWCHLTHHAGGVRVACWWWRCCRVVTMPKKRSKRKGKSKHNTTSPVPGLVKSITQHKNFRQLASYSVKCLCKVS